MSLTEKQMNQLKGEVQDNISMLMYYTRKECSNISVEDMENISPEQIEELIEAFATEMRRNVQ